MKGGLAAMMCALKDVETQDRVRVRFVAVPDEESEEIDDRSTDGFVGRGLGGNFAITGEPTDMHIGIEAKGVLVMRIEVHGRAAHSSTPWVGDNAVLKAIDVVSRDRDVALRPRVLRDVRSALDQSRAHRGWSCAQQGPRPVHDAVDVRYLPGQDPGEILAQVRGIPSIDVKRTFIHPPVDRLPQRPLRAGVARCGRPHDPAARS